MNRKSPKNAKKNSESGKDPLEDISRVLAEITQLKKDFAQKSGDGSFDAYFDNLWNLAKYGTDVSGDIKMMRAQLGKKTVVMPEGASSGVSPFQGWGRVLLGGCIGIVVVAGGTGAIAW